MFSQLFRFYFVRRLRAILTKYTNKHAISHSWTTSLTHLDNIPIRSQLFIFATFFLFSEKIFKMFQLWRYYYYYFFVTTPKPNHTEYVGPANANIQNRKKQIIFKDTYVYRWIILLCKVFNSNKCVGYFFFFLCAYIFAFKNNEPNFMRISNLNWFEMRNDQHFKQGFRS